ncbi:MAG: hypothetical protein MZW92_06955 [Comamonadaceae bacterium]|nr:hypothetical protein [Comamonadaceae bacterium]
MRRINGIGPKAGAQARSAGHRAPSASWRRASARWLVEHFGRSYGALAARRRARPRRPAGGDAQRAGVDEPRDHLRARPARGARPRRADRRSSPSCARRSPPTCSARATPARTIGIKLRYDDFRTVTRDLTLPAAGSSTPPPSAAPPACA